MKATKRNQQSSSRCSSGQTALEVLLIVVVYFIVAGDVPPQINEAHYLSRLKHYWDPAWCGNDLFLQSKDTQLLFIWLFGWLTQWVSLSATAWIGRLAAWMLTAWGWQRLSWRVVPRPLMSVLSAALFIVLNSYAHLAGEWVVGGVEAKCFAYAFVLFALRKLMDGHWNLVWILLGVATAFHPLAGGWSGILCVGIWWLDAGWARHPHPALSQRERVSKPDPNPSRMESASRMVPGFILGGLIALVGIVPALTLTWGVPPETVAESNRIYVFERLAHHLALLTVPDSEIARRFGGHAVLLLVLLGLCIIFRKYFDGATSMDRKSRDAAVDATDAKSLRVIAQFACGAALIAAIGLVIEWVFFNQPVMAAKLLRYYWFRTTDFAAAMATALYVAALISVGLATQRRWSVALLAVSLLAMSWFLGSTTWARYKHPVAVADQRLADFPAWLDVCEWVADSTPRDAVFITPRLNQSFKWRSGRAEVANRKDLPQDAGSIVAWRDRVKDIYTFKDNGAEYGLDCVGRLGTERVRELAKKYHAQFVVSDYLLSDNSQLLNLPIAFQNKKYVVYRIDN